MIRRALTTLALAIGMAVASPAGAALAGHMWD